MIFWKAAQFTANDNLDFQRSQSNLLQMADAKAKIRLDELIGSNAPEAEIRKAQDACDLAAAAYDDGIKRVKSAEQLLERLKEPW